MYKKITLLLAICLLCGSLYAQEKGERKRNLVVKEWNQRSGTTTPILDHVTTYDTQGRKIEEIEYYASGHGQKSRTTYEYEGDSRKVKKEVLYNDKNKVVKIKIYEYDETGRKRKQYSYRPNGKLETTKTFEYSYK